MAVFARYLILTIVLLISIADGRILSLNSSDDQLISNGINDGDSSTNLSSCRHQYGFLPCAENAAGYIFLIVVYQVLLVVGDKLMATGSVVIFNIIGVEFGGIIFRILRALPTMMVMIITGIYSDKENAQTQVSVVIGVYAGITVFTLTFQWFMCVVSASKSLNKETDDHQHEQISDSVNCFPTKQKLRTLIENGVTVDEDTCKTAKIMLFSLIPYVVLQPVYAFNTSSGKRIVILIALVFSFSSLISYFVYQILNPWMLQRSLNYYSELDNDGIRSIFHEADEDGDKCMTREEVGKLINRLFRGVKSDINQNDMTNDFMNKLDNNKDKIITEDEFINGFKQWIREAKQRASDKEFNPRKMYHKVLRLLKQKKFSKIDKIMSKILKQAEGQLMKSKALITDNGEADVERIQCLFKEFDKNGDGCLTQTEAMQLIGRVKFGTYQMEDEEVMKEMFIVFDHDGNNEIDEKEFMNAMRGYLERAIKAVGSPEGTSVIEDFDEILRKEEAYGKKDLFKSVFQVILGIAMLTFLAGPLMGNILDLSNAMNFPSYVISFVVVPLAMNGRTALAAILPASKKSEDNSSMTFSEIYSGVIMNNIAGLTTLLAIVFAKDLTWDFSAEVLTIMIVCAIVGTNAFLSKTYHLWTCIPAFLLYFISLGLFYIFQVFCGWN